MPALQPLPESGIDREWRSLARKLALAKGFCFIVYFVADERAVGVLKARLIDALRARAAHLIEVAVETAVEFAPQSLSRLFEASALPAFQQAHAAFWIEAFRGAGRPEWDNARRDFLMRLNERRSRIEDEVRCPLILLLPANWQRDAAALAPDMWHVRVHSAALQPVPTHGVHARVGMVVETDTAFAMRPLVPHEASAVELPAAVAHWHSVVEHAVSSQAAGDANATATASTLQDVSLWDGLAAVDAWLERQRPDLALPLVEQVVGFARQRAAAAAADATSPALRELSLVLAKFGEVASAQGRLDDAARAYDESLDIGRRLLRDSAGSPSALRDLIVSLSQVGDVAIAQGRLDAAAHAYDESWDIARQLLREAGESLPALRDLGVALGKVGDVASAQGRLDAAQQAYDEGLEIDRRLLREDGESLAALRDLSISLGKVGDVALAQGRLDAAARAHDESLTIARRLLRDSGESLPALRDVCVSLNKVGDVASAQARLDDAARAYDESLACARRLFREGGETLPALRDLCASLGSVGDVAIGQGRVDDAARAYDESLAIARRLLREGGETLPALRDLGAALSNVGDVARLQGRLDDAARALDEALVIVRRSLRKGAESLPLLRELSVVLSNGGDVATAQGRLDAAAQAHQESLEIDRRRVCEGGETPQNLTDLAASLLNVAALQGVDTAVRRASSQEALTLCERLTRVYPDLPFYADRLGLARRIADELLVSQPDKNQPVTAKR